MIYAIINGKRAIPSTSESKIKITLENQLVKDSGSYSYDIHFPMRLRENRITFGNIARMEASVRNVTYDDCKIVVDNRALIRGMGTIIQVTEKEVVLQIIGGKSHVKYNSRFTESYIDNLVDDIVDYRQANGLSEYGIGNNSAIYSFFSSAVLGEEGKYCLTPVVCFGDDAMLNDITASNVRLMRNIAPQPNLIYVLNRVLDKEGYRVTRNDYDTYPWNKLYIASGAESARLGDGLPHWSLYKFINEFQRLFNASFVFDEINKTVQVTRANEMRVRDVVCYQSVDEYTTEYDKDGMESLESSNLTYAFGSEPRGDFESIDLEILKRFNVSEVTGKGAASDQASLMTEREKKQTIWKVIPQSGQGRHLVTYMPYMIWTEDSDGSNGGVREVGMFSPLTRDSSTDNKIELHILPAAITAYTVNMSNGSQTIKFPAVNVEHRVVGKDSAGTSADGDEEDYVSVQEAIEGTSISESGDGGEDDDDSRMYVFFLESELLWDGEGETSSSSAIAGKRYSPVPYTAPYMWDLPPHKLPKHYARNQLNTLSFIVRGTTPPCSIGDLHEDSLRFDALHPTTIKFISEGAIPSPENLYSFRNKLYVCEKIEMEIGGFGVEKLFTGTFYAVTKL